MINLFKIGGEILLNGVEKVKGDLDSTNDHADSAADKFERTFKRIGTAVVTYFTIDKIKDFGQAIIEAAASVDAETAAFGQVMGEYSDEAKEKLRSVADETGVMDTRMTGHMTSLTAKFKGLGYDISDATDYAARGLTLASDAAAFWDKSLDDSMGSLNSFINGSYEGGEAIGLFANDTQMAQFAIKTGVVESTAAWASLDEATKQATRLEYAEAMYEQSGATGQAAKESGEYANTQANLSEQWRLFKAEIGEPILQNIVIPAMQLFKDTIGEATEKIKEFKQWCDDNKTAIELLGVVVGTLTALVVAYKIQQVIANSTVSMWSVVSGIATAATTAFNTALAFLTSPIGLVIIAIGALIAIGVVLYNHWDELKKWTVEKWEQIKQSVSDVVEKLKSIVPDAFEDIKKRTKEIWENIKKTIKDKIEDARKSVDEAIEKIKKLFDFEFEWPKLSLPHFTISGSMNPIDWLKNGVPKIGVEWYAKAMDKGIIMNGPTIFGYDAISDKYMGGGETGSETIVGTSSLMDMIRSAVSDKDYELVDVLYEIRDVLYKLSQISPKMVLDSGVLVGEILTDLDESMGELADLKGRGVK